MVDGVRGLVVDEAEGVTKRNRRGGSRSWLRHQPLARQHRRLGRRLPILHDATVLDGEPELLRALVAPMELSLVLEPSEGPGIEHGHGPIEGVIVQDRARQIETVRA